MALTFGKSFLFDGKNTKFSQAPGTLSYEGKYKDVLFHGETIKYNDTGIEINTFQNFDELLKLLNDNNHNSSEIMWINVIGLSNVEAIEAIGNHFKITKLQLEDIVHVSRHNKIDIQDRKFFSINQMIYLKDGELKTENLSIFFTKNNIITFQEIDGDVFDSIRERIKKNTGLVRRQKSEYLCYLLFDALVDNYLLVLNKIAYSVDLIEESIIDNQDANLNEVYNIKKQLLLLKTAMYPLLGIKELLKNDEMAIMSKEMEPYLNDLKDHIDQLSNEINIEREIVNNLFETHMLNVSNDMNKIMTTLTIYSAIFIPLSFMAGVFGMNFKVIPGLESPMGFYVFVGGCISLSTAMVAFFKWKKWF